jgi:hypothetical protein
LLRRASIRPMVCHPVGPIRVMVSRCRDNVPYGGRRDIVCMVVDIQRVLYRFGVDGDTMSVPSICMPFGGHRIGVPRDKPFLHSISPIATIGGKPASGDAGDPTIGTLIACAPPALTLSTLFWEEIHPALHTRCGSVSPCVRTAGLMAESAIDTRGRTAVTTVMRQANFVSVRVVCSHITPPQGP